MNKHITKAAHAYANMTTWSAIRDVLEGGCFHGSRSQRAIARISKIVNEQITQELAEYDIESEMILLSSPNKAICKTGD